MKQGISTTPSLASFLIVHRLLDLGNYFSLAFARRGVVVSTFSQTHFILYSGQNPNINYKLTHKRLLTISSLISRACCLHFYCHVVISWLQPEKAIMTFWRCLWFKEETDGGVHWFFHTAQRLYNLCCGS